MRLTLRTLLAYLDDTLEPHEIREIGQKVAESDAAQELVARIKQITRRRRLTTPPAAGPGARFDANTVAEYLDNELSSDLVADLEKTCLESDVHLAEVASCHQILTLVLGEPALVPPTARERMYGLVKGREAIPFRKARGRAGAAAGEGPDRDADDPLLPGMPSSRGWLIWALPIAAVLVLAVLAVAVWQGLAESHPPAHAVAAAGDKSAPPPEPPADSAKSAPVVPVTPADDPTKDKTAAPVDPTPPPAPADKDAAPPPKDKDKAPAPVEPPPPPGNGRPSPPGKEHVPVGRYLLTRPSVLVQREAGQPGWKRAVPGAAVFTADDLVSLPGYTSELDLGGPHVLLHGNVPEFSAFPGADFLMESAAQLHKPEAGFDVDMTLDRGRVYLSNHRADGPAKFRLRFADEVWDLTLQEPDTEVGVDLLHAYTANINYRDGEKPLTLLNLTVLNGKAGLVVEAREFPHLTAPIAVSWDNKGSGIPEPRRPPREELAIWDKAPPAGATQPERDLIAHMREALDKISLNMVGNKAVNTALLEARQSPDSPLTRALAVYCFGAIDAPDQLLDVLCHDEDPDHQRDREAAIFTLRRWLSRNPDNGNLLYDAKNDKAGPLLGAKYDYQPNDAKNILEELHDIPPEDVRKPETFEALAHLLHDKLLAVRELAYWHLQRLSVGAQVPLPPYNAADPAEKRDAAADAWRALIGKGLPPALPTAPGP